MVDKGSKIKISQSIAKWEVGINTANRALEAVGIYRPIDEVAVMFDTKGAAHSFIEAAVASSNYVKMFNVATDHVQTSPIASSYLVDYIFLETGLPWRIECMVIEQGFSPLHAALVHRKGSLQGNAVHYSFKVPDEEKYRQACGQMLTNGWELAQGCKSTYGTFSYWNVGEGQRSLLTTDTYLKPRVNVRDAGKQIADIASEVFAPSNGGYLSRKAGR